MTTVVVVDDEPIMRDALVALLTTIPGIDVIGRAGDGDEALALVAQKRPDVVLMDIRMPRLDGVEATRRIVAANLPSRVVLLTTLDPGALIKPALEAGAVGFVCKDASVDQLARAINEAAAGKTFLSPRASAAANSPAPRAPSLVGGLTAREREVLELVRQGMRNVEIAGCLCVTPRTVKAHVAAILRKTGARDRVHLVLIPRPAAEEAARRHHPAANIGPWANGVGGGPA